jgi:hypothetical protein
VHDLVLHLNTPPGAPTEADIPLIPDAYFGGLVLQQTPQHHVPLRDPLVPAITPTKLGDAASSSTTSASKDAGSNASGSEASRYPGPSGSGFVPVQKDKGASVPQPEPVTLTGTIQGRWGFDTFTGPTLPLQQQPGTGWHIVTNSENLIAGHSTQLLLASTGTACVHSITAQPTDHRSGIAITFKPQPLPNDSAPDAVLNQVLALTLPLDHDITPGDLHLAIQQFDQPKPDELSARTFSEPASVSSVNLHAGDKSINLHGTHLSEITQLALGDLTFTPVTENLQPDNDPSTMLLALPAANPVPPTHAGDHLTAKITLRDGRTLTASVTVEISRPSITLLSKSATPVPNSIISMSNPDDLPINASLMFTLKTPTNFPRNGQIEIETLDGTLRTVLTLAPSGGLLLQDPHTLVATLDPLRSFGPSAFGALHLRAVFPANISHNDASKSDAPPAIVSDWIPLVTLVRLPTLSQLQCPPDESQSCTLTGSSLFLVQSVASNPAFNDSMSVPDGYTGTTLTIPHIAAGTLFFKLRDEPNGINSAIFPTSPSTTRPRRSTPTAKQTSPAVSPGLS